LSNRFSRPSEYAVEACVVVVVAVVVVLVDVAEHPPTAIAAATHAARTPRALMSVATYTNGR